jgi:alpha-D-ribose 1-methylphosphonate 5-triphosphate synthase subunit PhnL
MNGQSRTFNCTMLVMIFASFVVNDGSLRLRQLDRLVDREQK